MCDLQNISGDLQLNEIRHALASKDQALIHERPPSPGKATTWFELISQEAHGPSSYFD